jgi:cysteine desulfurase/selenocysteine lyase
MLAERIRAQLSEIPHVNVQDLGRRRSGLISFTVDGVPAGAVRAHLSERNINIGANGVPYTPLDMQARKLTEIARILVSYFNTDAELDLLCREIAAVAKPT